MIAYLYAVFDRRFVIVDDMIHDAARRANRALMAARASVMRAICARCPRDDVLCQMRTSHAQREYATEHR